MRQFQFTISAEQTDLSGADEDVPYSDRQRFQFNESDLHNLIFIAIYDLAGVRA